MMRVLVSDPLPDVGLEVLQNTEGIDVDQQIGLKPDGYLAGDTEVRMEAC